MTLKFLTLESTWVQCHHMTLWLVPSHFLEAGVTNLSNTTATLFTEIDKVWSLENIPEVSQWYPNSEFNLEIQTPTQDPHSTQEVNRHRLRRRWTDGNLPNFPYYELETDILLATPFMFSPMSQITGYSSAKLKAGNHSQFWKDDTIFSEGIWVRLYVAPIMSY